jgi:quercetin dioxygenase-like cupin family protein
MHNPEQQSQGARNMSIFNKSPIVVSMLALALSSTVMANTTVKPSLFLPDTLVWKDAPEMPGAKIAVLIGNPAKKEFFVARLKLPANYVVRSHTHLINEYDTVISGMYYLGTGTKADTNVGVALTAGSFFFIPPNLPHYGYTKEETTLQISGTGPWGMVYKTQEG